MEAPVSSLSRLSASQVERASFTPGGCSQPNVQATKLPLESTSENALQALQRRLAEQDVRISLLEKELRKNRLAPTKLVEYEEDANEKQSVPGARSESAQSFNSKSPQPRGMHSGLAKSDGDALSAQMRYQILQLKLHSIVQKSRSIGVVDCSPLPSPPEQRPDLLDDVSPASEKPVTPIQDYSLDDLRAFESHLEMKAASSMNTHSDGGQKETIKALLEGIGSPTDVSQDYYTESKRLLPTIQPPASERCARRPIPVAWDGKVTYTLPTTSPFDDAAQEAKALNAQPRTKYPLGLFKHGLIFDPSKAEGNCYRTVAIANLPLSCCMRHLFQAVRGGPVLAAHLMNMERVAGYHMGIVTFVYEKDARAYVRFSQNHGVFFDDQRASIKMFKQATYPMSVDMEQKVSRGHTRCISIKGPHDPERYTDVVTYVKKALPVYFDLGDDMEENASKTELQIHFNSIEAASAAIEACRRYGRLANCNLSFTADPCSRSLPACPCH
ncbi:conserved hypothetical protein [Histoplasma capsulatum G186AR]|uniref:Uncharacterized protein n=2 Tax=Ajellomyces capsulatus TaxID=5037 RepID=C0NQF6_AJECG|nr:uncharacterized protein HCBG_05744 [Histoplasma capsulatum G186AR]EEH06428.1 conserved hypothetical protein [Histoplasma capsulatum G186AR]KAG5293110.1 hypothetical protein I7I52_04317 [Histoplasma capsulatum]QSS74561.1 hypothetical protein I7I50_03410 [Histoplasma capsulatum G186AR]